MAFQVPNFNLTVEVWTGPYLGKVSRGTSPANLAWGKRVQYAYQEIFTPEETPASVAMLLLFPAGSDVRSLVSSGMGDVIEVPQGSGRWYGVVSVDDIGKGFANEHRAAVINQISEFMNSTNYAGLFWPVPMT